MISVSARVSKASIDRVRTSIERKIAACQERVALRVYEYIIQADVDYSPGPNFGKAATPEWSGAFRASWRIRSGSVDPNYEVSPKRTHFEGVIYDGSEPEGDLNHTNYRIPIYISNQVRDYKGEHYAGKIENTGTPLHLQPWKIAANAANVFKHMKVF